MNLISRPSQTPQSNLRRAGKFQFPLIILAVISLPGLGGGAATLPADGGLVYYFNLTDSRGALVSSEHEEPSTKNGLDFRECWEYIALAYSNALKARGIA